MGSEAKYTMAYIHYLQDDLGTAASEIRELLKMKQLRLLDYDKCMDLKSKIFVKQKDYVQAEQNLKSVKEHYPIPDDGIIEEANLLWEEIIAPKEAEENKEEESPETKIEINEE